MVYRNRVYDQAIYNPPAGQTWEEFKTNTGETALNIDFDPIRDIISKGTGLNASNISVYGYEVPVFVDAEATVMDMRHIIMFVILAILLFMLLFGVMRGMPKEEVIELEPELSVEELLETTKMEEAKEAAMSSLQEIELDKEPEAKRLIDKFVNERPEAVAQLMRNWLNDNWE
jgi:flagellar M-ring protein FliF